MNKASNGSGNINLGNIEWDSYDIKLQDGYSDYSIIMSDPVMPVNLSPNETKELILYLK